MFCDESSAEIVKIEYLPIKSCFVLIPKSFNIKLNEKNNLYIFKIESIDNSNKFHYLSWNGEYSNKKNTLQINPLYALKLNLKNDQEVLLKLMKYDQEIFPNCEKCFIEPVTENDWEILSLNSSYIENNLLNQIRVIMVNQIFPIYIQEGNLCTFVKVYGTKEFQHEVFILQQFTEIIVHQPSNQDLKKNQNEKVSNERVSKEKSNVICNVSINKPKTSDVKNLIGGVDDLISKCILFVKNSLSLDQLASHINSHAIVKPNSLLIYGPKGCGKTSILDFVLDKMKNENFIYYKKIDCKLLKGKRIESLQKSWFKSLDEAMHHKSSLIVFEDLDNICTNLTKPENEASSDMIYYERVGVVLINIIRFIEKLDSSKGNMIAMIATCKSKKSLHPSLIESRGRHVFTDFVEITLPSLGQRVEMLSALISNKLNLNTKQIHDLNLKEIATKCDGFLPIDLSLLTDRAIHSSSIRNGELISDNLTLTNQDFDSAFDGFLSLSMRNVNLHLKSSIKWCDIGGLEDIKQVLTSTLLWPCKYPNLFSKLPLKKQTGILLFGPPGTGKTLLAEAASNECGMNFINVKGPELLSKYIGASELAVRDLFTRASCAKPCIIFFDEFDSIAPRRGHDSTGVTDRVVNQLLTQMDGVEQLHSGVYVLAATSRPDLLDPALLRPGRFDKCLYCPMPDQSQRNHILNVLTHKLSLCPDIDLHSLSTLTQHFTGADLQALLYNAQLEALYQTINNNQHITSHQHNKQNQLLLSQTTQFIAHMPSVQLGFTPDCNHVMDQVQTIKSNITNCLGLHIYHHMSSQLNQNHSKQHNILINQKHLLTALQNTRPSVNEFQRNKYQNIYKAFLENRGQFFHSYISNDNAKKVTLA